MDFQWNWHCFVAIVWCVSIQRSSQCLFRYITPPVHGYSCQLPFYKNISDISLQLCVATCVCDGTCWTLSYNQPGSYCILTHEACVSAEANPNFVMMGLRSNETQPCIEWIPFSSNYGEQNGYPERAITGISGTNRRGAVSRAITGQKLWTGQITTYAYRTYLLDSNQMITTLRDGFDILVVHTQCSTAWVPYSAGELIPPGAVVAGSENSVKRYVIEAGLSYVRFGSYTTGDTHGYYSSNGDVFSCTNMRMLVTLLGWYFCCVFNHLSGRHSVGGIFKCILHKDILSFTPGVYPWCICAWLWLNALSKDGIPNTILSMTWWICQLKSTMMRMTFSGRRTIHSWWGVPCKY